MRYKHFKKSKVHFNKAMNFKTYFKLQSWVRNSLFFKSLSSVLS